MQVLYKIGLVALEVGATASIVPGSSAVGTLAGLLALELCCCVTVRVRGSFRFQLGATALVVPSFVTVRASD